MAGGDNDDQDGGLDISTKVQKSGVLYKKPFGRGGGALKGLLKRTETTEKWQKRFFLLKDGYLLWYPEKERSSFEATGLFNTHPKGVIPLGGSHVEPVNEGPPTMPFGISVTHPDFGAGHLMLAAESGQTRALWVSALNLAGKVTWSNAQIGEATLEKLRAQGTTLEREKAETLNKLQEVAVGLAKEKDQRELFEAMASVLEEEKGRVEKEAATILEQKQEKERQLETTQREKEEREKVIALKEDEVKQVAAEKEEVQKRNRALSANLQTLSSTASALEQERVELSSVLEKTVEVASELRREKDQTSDELEAERLARVKLEKRLKMAEASLARLDAALRKSGVKLDLDIDLDVKALRSFFSERVEEVQRAQNSAAIVKEGLRAKKDFDKTEVAVTPEDVKAAAPATEVVEPGEDAEPVAEG